MASIKLTYKGKADIVYKKRDVEFQLYATAWSYYQKETREEPEYDESVIDEIEITDARFTDTNEPVTSEEIYEEVYNELQNNFDKYFSYKDEDDRYSGEMDCVDRWRVAHGIEV